MSDYKIVKTVELSGMPNPALAKDLLERLKLTTAKVVENRKWRIPVLKEFYPKNRSLLGLNVNRGQSIMIRLREGHDQMTFLPWESVLGTLVHELTHNEIGEHSAEFYKMMEKVYDDVDASTPSVGGLWGPRAPTPKYLFDGKSAKVGGGALASTTGIANTNVKQLAAEAAMRRMGQFASNATMIDSRRSAKTRKELFLEAEEKRRMLEAGGGQGCSVLKPSQTNVAQAHSSHGNSQLDAGVWVCQVCFEENTWSRGAEMGSSSSSSHAKQGQLDGEITCCNWCGCAHGSSLPGSSTDDIVRKLPSTTTSASGDIFCIDCDSTEQFVDLIEESGVGKYEASESSEVMCQWTHLVMRRCPCCVPSALSPPLIPRIDGDTKIGNKRKQTGSADDVIIID